MKIAIIINAILLIIMEKNVINVYQDIVYLQEIKNVQKLVTVNIQRMKMNAVFVMMHIA